MRKKIDLLYLIAEIKRLDPKAQEGSEDFSTALMLLAGLIVGANEKKISQFTELPLYFIRPRAKRLREHGVWDGNKSCVDWFRKGEGGIAFWMDVLVAQGLMKRSIKNRSES